MNFRIIALCIISLSAINLANAAENTINDITQLNPIEVAGILEPTNEQQIIEALKLNNIKVSIGGGKFSQGGQTGLENSLHLDMRKYNEIVNYDKDNKKITVQSGITWRDIQEVIDKDNLAIKIMQTYANFTVGGTLSVNAHGRYIGAGPVINSVDSISIILANGEVKQASRTNNKELFFAVIGGYGGIGVISEVTLNLVENTKVKRKSERMDIEDYSKYFFAKVRDDKKIVFHNADIYPPHYKTVNSVNWIETSKDVTTKERLIPKNDSYTITPNGVDFIASGDFGKWVREYIFDPVIFFPDTVHYRNYEASYDAAELEPESRKEYTYGLREYFIPVENFDEFSKQMAKIFIENDVNVINVSIRHSKADDESYLAWAKGEVFSFVVYYRQGVSEKAKKDVAKWSKQMVDATISAGGTYYLPYQLHQSTDQFLKAYPKANKFFAVKKQYDPNNRFSNKLWQKHY
tara:strand:+ start:2178 stop:3569 length:1392 start_codon:yes stop_codon:yes gene_type:complete